MASCPKSFISTGHPIPRPVRLSKESMSAGFSPSFFKASTIAKANGCSDFNSAHTEFPYARLCHPASRHYPVTTGQPSVTVPVLSSTTVSTFRICSKATASFIKICDSAPLPIPTIKAVGVASPKAHGQAITKTDTAESIA